MNNTSYSSLAGRAMMPFLCLCALWIIFSHAVIPGYWGAESDGRSGKLFADGLFLIAAAVAVLIALRRTVRDVRSAENELRHRDDRARVAVDASGDGAWEVNAPSPAESYSGEVFSLLGIQPVAVNDIFLAFRERIHPDDRSKLQDANDSIQKPGQDQLRLKCRIRDNEGQWRHISMRGRCVERGLGGRPARIAGILSDVTEESEREAELVTSRDMLNALLGATPFPTAVVDANGTLILASDSWRRAAAEHGFDVWLPPSGTLRSHAQASGKNRSGEHNDLHEAIQDVLAGRHSETTLPVKTGEAGAPTRPEAFLRPYKKGDEIAGAVIALSNVSEEQVRIGQLLRQTEELQQQNALLQSLTDKSQRELAELKGQNDRFQSENEALQRRVDEVLKQSEELLRENEQFHISNDDLEFRIGDLQRQIEHLEPARAELEGRTATLCRQSDELERKNQELEIQNVTLQGQTQELSLRAEELRIQNDEYRLRIEELSRRIEEAERNNKSLQEVAGQLQIQNRDYQNTIEQTHREFTDIQRAHDMLMVAADSSPLAILTVDETLHATQWCNAAVEALFGWPRDEVLGRRAPMIAQEDESTFLEACRQAKLGSAPRETRAKCMRKDGLFRDVALWAQALPDSVTTHNEVILIMSDVTTQFAREQALRQAQRDLERIFASLPQAVVVIDPDSHAIRMCSPAVESVLGCSPESLPGRTTQHLYRDDAEYYEFCLWSKTALDANHLFRRTCKMLREDGQEFDAVQTVVPLNGPGDPSLIMVFVEVSAHTQPEPDTARAGLGADALLNVQNLGAMIYRSVNSQDWTLKVVSDGARAITGYAPGAFTQSGYPFLKEIIHEPDREHVLTHIRDAVAGAGIFDVRYQIKSATGELRWVDHQGAVVRSPDGNGEWVEGMIVDITRDMRLREALVLHRQQMQSLLYHMLQSLERVREGVAGRIQRSIAGHLLQSTAGLHGAAGKNRKKALAGELQSVQKTLETAIEDCNALAGEMVPPVLERVGLNAALEYLLRDFRLRHQLYASLKWFGSLDRLDRDLEKFLYRSTEELIHNVFAHAGVTEARVSVRVQNDLIRVAVKDFGKGFPSRDASPKIIGQRGYGLFMIRECATHLGGTCIVATRRGTGSRVTIEIPLPLASQSPTPQDENARVDLSNETIELHEL